MGQVVDDEPLGTKPPTVLLGDGEREDGIIIVAADADADADADAEAFFFLGVDAAISRGSTKSATDPGHAQAAAAVASTTRTILSGASEEGASALLSPPLPPFFAGGVGAVFEVRAIRLGKAETKWKKLLFLSLKTETKSHSYCKRPLSRAPRIRRTPLE